MFTSKLFRAKFSPNFSDSPPKMLRLIFLEYKYTPPNFLVSPSAVAVYNHWTGLGYWTVSRKHYSSILGLNGV